MTRTCPRTCPRISPRAVALAALALAACTPGDGPLMDPGQDCVGCHASGDAPDWSVAGTVFPSTTSPVSDGVRGVRVRLTDANGRIVTIVSNEAGNFYLADRLAFPLARVELERDGRVAVMAQEDGTPIPVEYGGCNRCHTVPPPPDDGPSGRLAAP